MGPTDLPSKAAYSKTIEEQRSKLSTAGDKGALTNLDASTDQDDADDDADVNISEECSQKSNSEIFREELEAEEDSPQVGKLGRENLVKNEFEDDSALQKAAKESLEKKESVDVFSSREESEEDSPSDESSEEDSDTKEETPSPDDSVSPTDEATSENENNDMHSSLYGKTQMEEYFAQQREADKRERESLCKRNPVMMKREVYK